MKCPKRYVHDWRSCPFAHPTENARRRDPREVKYMPVPVQITSVAYASWCDLHLVKICARCFRLQAGHSQPVRGMLQVAATAHCIIISSIIVTKPASGGQNNLT